MKYLILGIGLLLVLGNLTACKDDDPGQVGTTPLLVTITASAATVSESAPVTLTITIENTGDSPLEWGSGSSSCRLFARVTVDGQDHAVPPFEICTADMVTYDLDPGETDTQTKNWNGVIGRDGSEVGLPEGTYRIHGIGGEVASAPVTIEVVK